MPSEKKLRIHMSLKSSNERAILIEKGICNKDDEHAETQQQFRTLLLCRRCKGLHWGFCRPRRTRTRRTHGRRLPKTPATISSIRKNAVGSVFTCNHDTELRIDSERHRDDSSINDVEIIHAADFGVRCHCPGIAAFT